MIPDNVLQSRKNKLNVCVLATVQLGSEALLYTMHLIKGDLKNNYGNASLQSHCMGTQLSSQIFQAMW